MDYRCGVLLPFLSRQDVHTFIQTVPVSDEPRDVFARWIEMKRAAQPLPLRPADPYAPLPTALADAVATRLARLPIVESNYFDEPAPRVVYVELRRLVSNQYHVDLDYVDRLTRTAARARTPARLAAFCLPQPRLPDPLVVGSRTSQEVVVEDIAYLAGRAEVRRINAGVVELRLRLIPAGNFLTCAEADGGVCPVVVAGNGTHRMLALLRAGHTHAPVLVRQAFSAGDLGLGRPTGFGPEALGWPRPPLVADFLDPTLCAEVRATKALRSSRLILELNSERPRIPGRGR